MKINPLALTKSREYLGLSLEEAATILGYKKEKLALWERTEEGQRQLFEAKEHPTYKQLTHLQKKTVVEIYNFSPKMGASFFFNSQKLFASSKERPKYSSNFLSSVLC